MGLFSGLGRIFNPDSIAMSQALLAGDYGAVGQLGARRQQLELERQRLMAAQDQQQQAQNIRNSQMDAAQRLGWSKDQLAATNADDLSQLVRERYTPRQYGATGGSTGYTNPDGTTRYEVAPYHEQVGRSIIGAGPNGADPRVLFRGVEMVPVPNVGVFGATDQRLFDASSPPPLGFIPRSAVTGQTPPISGDPRNLPPGDPRADPAGPPSADVRPMGQEAPAFNANPADLANMPPVTSYRGVEFGSPLAGGPPRNMPRAGRAPRVPRGIVTVNSPEQAARLPRGTRFRTPDGRVIVRQ